jgi:hypothetical protein
MLIFGGFEMEEFKTNIFEIDFIYFKKIDLLFI